MIADICAYVGRDKKHLVQLALNYDSLRAENKLPDFGKDTYLMSEKLDGVFCFAVKKDDEVIIYSRTGEIYTSMKHIEAELKLFMSNDEVIIFEAYRRYVPQSTISGWCRDTKNQHRELKAYCHTLVPLDDFVSNHSQVTFSEGDSYIKQRYHDSYSLFDSVNTIPQIHVLSVEHLMTFANSIWSAEGEGVVLRRADATYNAGKRNKDIIKVKQGVSFDLKVVGVAEGKGKYKGTLGALVCQWKDGKTINISGMTDEERKLWWDDPNSIINAIVQVDGMRLSSKGLIREPRFKGIRYEKIEGDY